MVCCVFRRVGVYFSGVCPGVVVWATSLQILVLVELVIRSLLYCFSVRWGEALYFMSLPLLMGVFAVSMPMFGSGGLGLVLSNGGGFIWSEIGGILVEITIIVTCLRLLARVDEYSLEGPFRSYGAFVILLGLLRVGCFLSDSLLLMVFFFESCLIPIIFIILWWGHQPEREEAAYYTVFYMLVFSLPAIISTLVIMGRYATDSVVLLNVLRGLEWGENVRTKDPFRFRLAFWFFFLAGFLVKTPMFVFHVWLPKAHVEAPLGGSMMLAGVLLKLGRFGLMRALCALRIYNHTPKTVLFSFLLLGGLLRALVCLVQSDLKSMVAYSSVSHINLTRAAVMTDRFGGWRFAVVSIVSHGLISPCLFVLVYCVFKRVGSRRVATCRGFLKSSPVMAVFWFLFCVANFRCPPRLSYFGEVGVLVALFNF